MTFWTFVCYSWFRVEPFQVLNDLSGIVLDVGGFDSVISWQLVS